MDIQKLRIIWEKEDKKKNMHIKFHFSNIPLDSKQIKMKQNKDATAMIASLC